MPLVKPDGVKSEASYQHQEHEAALAQIKNQPNHSFSFPLKPIKCKQTTVNLIQKIKMSTEHETEITYNLELLEKSQKMWKESAGLRAVYIDLYKDIQAVSVPGKSLELGSGIGVSQQFIKETVTSDITKTPFVDCSMSAYDIQSPAGRPWSNIFALARKSHKQIA